MKASPLFLFFLCVISQECPANELAGKKAYEYIGNLTQKIGSSDYSVIIMNRRDRSLDTFSYTDGLLFNPNGDKYKYIRRLDGDHSLKLNLAEGTTAEKATREKVPDYEKLIRENKLKPYVILDEQSREVCIIYCGLTPCFLVWHKNKKGQILLDVRESLMQSDFFGNDFMLRKRILR